MVTLKAERIKKNFGHRRVLSELNLLLESGEIYVLFGPNGSGKSTLSLLLASLLKPTNGLVKFENKDIHKLNSLYRRKVGLLTHSSFLYENLTAFENLKFFAGLYNIRNIKEKIEELSKLYEIDTRMNEPVRNFSRGMIQRLSIIRALINEPEIILMDEPYTGLDEVGAQILEGQLLWFKNAGKIVFVTTHNLLRGYGIATKIGILSKGKIRFETQKEKIEINKLNEIYRSLIHNETL